jgi:hypothetical protein
MVWQLMTVGAGVAGAVASAAIYGSASRALAAFACTCCVVAAGFQTAFRVVGRGRRPLVAARRFFIRTVRVGAFVTAALAFASVAIAGTLLESGIYKLPLPAHAAAGATPRRAAPQHAASGGVLDRQTPLVPLGLQGERHTFSGLLAPGAPVRLRDLTTGAPGATIADASGTFVFERGVVGHLYELSVPGRRARLRLLYRAPIDLR